ncbi:MAG: periplasmic heavy metal sensor [Desulfobacteraceae bacterium]|nr:periplasmic heavy metal sensor [Desulfobacteraceae bacterium]
MKSKLTTKSMIIGAAILLVGAAVALANGGPWGNYGGNMMGYGYGMGPGMMGYGMGPGMMGYGQGYGMGPGMMYGYGPRGSGAWGNLTDEQRTKLDAAQEKFFNDTQKLRDQIQDKRFALQNELTKDTPDAAKVGTLQKELSSLEGEFDQKAIQHQLEIRKLLPENTRRGFARGYGGGYCWQ